MASDLDKLVKKLSLFLEEAIVEAEKASKKQGKKATVRPHDSSSCAPRLKI
jgi:hypothetical protein